MTEPTPQVRALADAGGFIRRHLGPGPEDRAGMLEALGFETVTELLDATVPSTIRDDAALDLPDAAPEAEILERLAAIAAENDPRRAYIGLGYHGTITPAVIRRNVLEDPGWYTSYTPYQPEISQGRLEALLVFQTMVGDLTGTELANASLLDEPTAAAEGLQLCRRVSRKRVDEDAGEVVLVDAACHPQTLEVVTGRMTPLGVEVVVCDLREELAGAPGQRPDHVTAPDGATVALDRAAAALLQSPDTDGRVHDDTDLIAHLHDHQVLSTVATDLLACTLVTPPGEQDADVVVGSSQRFGVPMMAGGPHAAFM
ncbi:MAG: glycine dehydrogenase (aminomethyl-transferring), partial [Actinomycetota bacterium]